MRSRVLEDRFKPVSGFNDADEIIDHDLARLLFIEQSGPDLRTLRRHRLFHDRQKLWNWKFDPFVTGVWEMALEYS
jgi:hypothetical protein